MVNTKSTEKVADVEALRNIPRGRPKSGRTWKTVKKHRYSTVTTGKPLKTSWEEKMRKKAQAKSIKDFEKQLKEERAKEKETARLKAEEKKKRQEENARKAEIVQTVKNPAKLKRLRKKQLRKIQKR